MRRSSRDSVSSVASFNISLKLFRAVMAILEATSPPACPPMPSATAIKREEIRAESSFPSLTKPTSERESTLKARGWLDMVKV